VRPLADCHRPGVRGGRGGTKNLGVLPSWNGIGRL
jgi:hypothetical protein